MLRRHLLFLLACIPLRIALILIYKYINVKFLPYVGGVLLIPALGFLSLYIFNLRQTGIETGNNIIWWNKLRVIHGIIYLGAAIFALKKEKHGWILLFIDVLIGLISFLIYHKFIKILE